MEYLKAILTELFDTLINDWVKTVIVSVIIGTLTFIFRYRSNQSTNRDTELSKLRKRLDRLHELANSKIEIPFALVGSVYLDIRLDPIDAKKLGRDEWSNINSPKYDLGGSSIWVGRYLWKEYGKKSHVFSIKGGNDDILTNLFDKLLEKEKWLENDLFSGQKHQQTALTIHLVQRFNKFTTMFTHTGVLDGFNWEREGIQNKLKELLKYGGVLYISGYLKTNLRNELDPSLREIKEISENTIVCIDHGRLMKRENSTAIDNLSEAFINDRIDVYFCTYKELREFDFLSRGNKLPFRINFARSSLSAGQVRRNLEKLAKKGRLPLLTIVRSREIAGDVKVYVIVGDKVFPIEGTPGEKITTTSVGLINAFNASFMYSMLHDSRCPTLEKQITHAAQVALKTWRKYSELTGTSEKEDVNAPPE